MSQITKYIKLTRSENNTLGKIYKFCQSAEVFNEKFTGRRKKNRCRKNTLMPIGTESSLPHRFI